MPENWRIRARSLELIVLVDVDDEYGEMRYSFGGPKEFCLLVTVPPEEDIAMIHDVMFKTRCCTNRVLKRGHGDIELLVKAGLTWILKRHPKLVGFDLSDKSNWHNVPIPEARMFHQGATWYQAHFGAEPLGCQNIVREYLRKRAACAHVKVWDRAEVERWLEALRLPQLTGTMWRIGRGNVVDWAFDVSEERVERIDRVEGLVGGGWGVRWASRVGKRGLEWK